MSDNDSWLKTINHCEYVAAKTANQKIRKTSDPNLPLLVGGEHDNLLALMIDSLMNKPKRNYH